MPETTGDRWIGLLAAAALLAMGAACGGNSRSNPSPSSSLPSSTTTTVLSRVLSMTVATSSGLVGLNIDDTTCEFAVRRGLRTPATPLTYTVKDEAGVIVATGTLTSGRVTGKRPAYRCTTEVEVTLTGPAKFIQVEFANGQRATGPADAPLTVELT